MHPGAAKHVVRASGERRGLGMGKPGGGDQLHSRKAHGSHGSGRTADIAWVRGADEDEAKEIGGNDG
ncbi:hypothetical protein DYGSA30_44490 [Dyella sp. GSA-30]|nr:hypothetical protein DYGSA30_44490 [Dyella sp. GSA-30]